MNDPTETDAYQRGRRQAIGALEAAELDRAMDEHPTNHGRPRRHPCSVCKDPDAPTRWAKLRVSPSVDEPFGFGVYGWACPTCADHLEKGD